eukprot:scaffold30252_cov78-Skeletonema_dohrnii-CCMP3373.AAC.4
MSSPQRPIQLLFRSKECVELYTLADTSSSAAPSSKPSQGGQILYAGKTTFHLLSPNGSAAFIHDASVGLIKCDLSSPSTAAATATTTTPFLQNSKAIQLAKCSPRGSYLLTWERPSKDDNNNGNLKVWSAANGALLQ